MSLTNVLNTPGSSVIMYLPNSEKNKVGYQ